MLLHMTLPGVLSREQNFRCELGAKRVENDPNKVRIVRSNYVEFRLGGGDAARLYASNR